MRFLLSSHITRFANYHLWTNLLVFELFQVSLTKSKNTENTIGPDTETATLLYQHAKQENSPTSALSAEGNSPRELNSVSMNSPTVQRVSFLPTLLILYVFNHFPRLFQQFLEVIPPPLIRSGMSTMP